MKSILNEGKKAAIDIKKELLTLEEYRNKSRNALGRESKTEKQLRSKEREIEDEIASVTRKRRNDVEETYRNQIDKSKAQLKKVSGRREKSKDAKMSERIKEETAELVSENRLIRSDIKSMVYKEKIPSVCVSSLFLSLFMPSNPIDLIKLLIVVVICLVPIPMGIMAATPWNESIFLKVLLYTIIILVVGVVYIVACNTVVSIHRKVLDEVRNRKKKIHANEKKIKSITKSIKREKDDSMYNLDKYDKELDDINDELDKLVKEQKESLETFENSTKHMIENEIRTKHEKELSELEENYQKAKKDSDRLEDVVSKMSLDISKKYDAYMGKEFMKLDKIEALIEIMEKGEAKTIGEAIEVYKSKYAV